MLEIWKDIVGYEGLYQVSNMGRVKSLKYRRSGKEGILKEYKYRNNYINVNLYKDGIRKSHYLHRLVADAFLPNPENLPIINHKSEKPWENWVELDEDGNVIDSNLEWCTQKYNLNYADAQEKRVASLMGGGNFKCNLMSEKKRKTVLQFTKEGEFVAEYPSMLEAERQIGIARGNIWACCKGKYKSAGGFIWRYKNIA